MGNGWLENPEIDHFFGFESWYLFSKPTVSTTASFSFGKIRN
jgi:hypothetical protein